MSDDIDLARQALRRFVAKIVVNEKAGTIFYTFPLQDFSRKGMCPHRAVEARDGSGLNSVSAATTLVLRLLYLNPVQPEKSPSTHDRNELIRTRYAAGETLEVLAQAFHLSVQRIHQIVRRRHH
jgi:hypothetical protein